MAEQETVYLILQRQMKEIKAEGRIKSVTIYRFKKGWFPVFEVQENGAGTLLCSIRVQSAARMRIWPGLGKLADWLRSEFEIDHCDIFLSITNGETEKAMNKRMVLQLLIMLALMAVCGVAMAQGVSTATSSLQSVKSWMMTWIPIASTVLIIVTAIGWMIHLIRLDWAVRFAMGLIVIGSASYLVGLFGLS